jgi:hypothetical protein
MSFCSHFLIIGAPGFEPGTSSPPDFSVLWRGVGASGGEWLGYGKSGLRHGFRAAFLHASFSDVWAPIGPHEHV